MNSAAERLPQGEPAPQPAGERPGPAGPATPLHHVRQLRWSAGTHDRATAEHLRHCVQQRGEQVADALARALDGLDPGASRTLHVRQLRLRLEAGWLEQTDDELAAHVERAVRQAWSRIEPAALTARPMAAGRQAPRPPAQTEALPALHHYLDSGAWPAPFAALAGAERGRVMQQAALQLAGQGELLRLGGRAGNFDRRVEWFRRWLTLWDADGRQRWLARRFDPSPTPTDPGAADTLEQLERLMPCLAGEALLDAQAVWMAATAPGPVSFDPLRRANDVAIRDGALARWLGRLSAAPTGAAPPPAC